MLMRLEQVLARVVEGCIAGIFRLRVQPAEIGRQLERAMLERRVSSVGTTLAPNRYVVHLHPADAADFADWEEALCRELESWLAEVAFARGLATVGPILVSVEADASVPRRAVRAAARFTETAPSAPDRRSHAAPFRALRLTPVAGAGSSVVVRDGPLTVGRATENDLVLRDAEVSRFHARIAPAAGEWQVVDLGSTNGTWVNGERVRQAALRPGDTVAFAGVTYAVAPG
jgi:hypothetical protein